MNQVHLSDCRCGCRVPCPCGNPEPHLLTHSYWDAMWERGALRDMNEDISSIARSLRITQLELWHLRFDLARFGGLDHAHAQKVADGTQSKEVVG